MIILLLLFKKHLYVCHYTPRIAALLDENCSTQVHLENMSFVPVQESLAVVYAPSNPRVYTIYEPVIRLKGQAKTVVTQRPFSSKEVQSLSLEPGALRALLPTETQGLQSVLHKIGGLGTFVFLYARVG